MNEQMLDYVKAEKFDACIALGKNYLKDHPNSSINDEVHFWIGRAYREKFLAVQRHLYKKAYKAYKRKELAYWLDKMLLTVAGVQMTQEGNILTFRIILIWQPQR